MGDKRPVPILDYVLPLDTNRYADSTIVGMTGPKRGGKSLYLAMLLYRDMEAGRTVWSNMNVRTPDPFLKQGKPMLKTQPIDWDGLYLLDEKYQHGTVGLDESVYYDDSRASLSMRNRLMNTLMNQVGHRSLNIYYTVKSQGWLDKRLQFETDVEIECYDLAKTDWGHRHNTEPGTMIHQTFLDKSGAITGKVHDYKNPYSRPIFTGFWANGKDFWTAYDTTEIIGLEEINTGIKLDMKQRVISNKTHSDDAVFLATIHELATGIKEKTESIDCGVFRAVVAGSGVEVTNWVLGQALRNLGVVHHQKRGGNEYDLSNLVEGI